MLFNQCSNYIEAPLYQVYQERIYFSEQITTQKIVEGVIWPSGKKVLVPIVNGYMPAIRTSTLPNGCAFYEYNFNSRVVYPGGLIEYGDAPKKYSESPIYDVGPTEKPIKIEARTPKTLQAAPIPIPILNNRKLK